MDTNRVVVLLAVITAVLALGLAAPSLYDLDAGGGDGQPEDRTTPEGNGVELNETEEESIQEDDEDDNWLIALGRLLLIPILVGLLYWILKHEPGRFVTYALSVIAVVVALVIVLELLRGTPVPYIPDTPSGSPVDGTGDLQDGGGDTTVPGDTAPMLLLLFMSLVGVAFYYRYVSREADSEDTTQPRTEDDGSPSEATAAVGRAAGRAADRFADDESLENAIYQAWHEVTSALAVQNPATKTPSEFATAATDAGMDADDVHQLTSLFRDVRYGEAPVTPARETTAQETLRRIEHTYAAPAGSPDERDESADQSHEEVPDR